MNAEFNERLTRLEARLRTAGRAKLAHSDTVRTSASIYDGSSRQNAPLSRVRVYLDACAEWDRVVAEMQALRREFREALASQG